MFQYSQGKHTTQGHKGIPEGHFEEEQGRKGFFGPVSHLIKQQPSTRWVDIQGPLRPQLFDAIAMEKNYGVMQRLMFSNDLTVSSVWMRAEKRAVNEAFRNADGDTLYFVHQGQGVVLTEYGLLPFRKGHYLVIPKCVTHSIVSSDETYLLVIESHASMFREPDRGMLGKNAFYDPASFGKPDLEKQQNFKKQTGADIRHVSVKRSNEITKFSYSSCYFDTVGWKGDFYPFALHVDDLMPLLSARVHLPPSAHTTFVANSFVVCTFLPRPLETDADALKVPFYHQNIDYDEVLFYHDGNFFSRDNLHAGMMTLHPAGFPHGPHPKAVKNIGSKTHTDECAVMIDSWQKLEIDPALAKVEVQDYWKSWMK
jgi:homogentisate 1,2-dioxygenase